MSGASIEDSDVLNFAGIPLAAFELESVRPTAQDIECLETQLPDQKSLRFTRGRQTQRANLKSAENACRMSLPSPTEKHGYWPVLLAAALGSRIQLPENFKKLNAFSALASEEFARLLAAVRKHAVSSDCGNEKLNRTSAWVLSRSSTLPRSPAPVHAALLGAGATEAASQARAEVQKHAFQLVNMGRFGDKKLPCVRDLARLQWLGADWMATDSLKRTALHILCATTGHKYMSRVLHTSTVAVLARFLCSQAPRAVLLEDAEGLTPLNYLVAPFRASAGCVGSVHRELLLAIIDFWLQNSRADCFSHCVEGKQSIHFCSATCCGACSAAAEQHECAHWLGCSCWRWPCWN